MRNPFSPGAEKVYHTRVTPQKVAQFHGNVVHPVYATFAVAQDAEWACRLFVLDMLEVGEEGIGTFVSVKHIASVPVGAEVTFRATLLWVRENTLHCSWEGYWQGKRFAHGEQTQKILKKS
ncbi:MAG: thioesterase family protein [Bacteroidia bacterium]